MGETTQLTAERWQQAKLIVADALEEGSIESRAALVTQRCAGDPLLLREVESLLEQTTGLFEECAEDVAIPLRRDLTTLDPGRRIGAYAIVREIGRGGMGAVYLAQRADGAFEKKVAIKVLKRGLDTDEILRRFLAERQILARLDHPSIVRLIDGGTTDDGLPYLAMDYVEGLPITQFAREHQLSVQERLKLFRAVCSAVTYAHQNLIVHRDLKPSNILITKEGEVRLLDFGIAKLLEPEAEAYAVTMTMLRVMTPEYASPEQVKGGPVTTVSDVYSLGVIFYELLTEERPYRLKHRTPDEISKAICEQEPERPSTTVAKGDGSSKLQVPSSKLLRGDLDNIVLRALRKEPERRYASVDQLSDDIRRHLEGLPIQACKDTFAYRSGKFIQRHKIGVAAAAMIVAVLVGGIIATTWEWRAAKAERAKAEVRFEILRKSSRTMISEIHGALQNLSGTLEARKLLLQRATEQLDALSAEASDAPRLQLDLAIAYKTIGYLPDQPVTERTKLLQKSIDLSEKVLARDPRKIAARENLATCKLSLADFARTRGENDQALTYNREAIALLEAVAREEPLDMGHKQSVWNASYNMALTLSQLGRAEEGLAICRRIYPIAVELREKHSADPSDHRFRRPYLSRALAAGNLTYLGRYDEAIAEIRAALEENAAARQRFPLGPFERLDQSVFNYRLAIALERGGKLDQAIEKMHFAATLAETLLADEAKDFSCRINAALENLQLGSLLLRTGKGAESIKYFRRAAEVYEKVVAADDQQKQAKADLACTYGALGYAEAKTDNVSQGLVDEHKALASYNKLDAAKTSNVFLLHDYAEALARTGETCLLINPTPESATEAKAFLERSLSIWTLMRDRHTLCAADAGKPDEVAARIAQCDTALKRFRRS
jgi:tRNA A-37 threonylcarbamoyl transferase component Bud32/tetratricopeptide (TPR) repeat protein